VVNAIWTWGVARLIGSRVLLRIEDHDRTRCRAEYEAALLEDLEWLGFEPDLVSGTGARGGRKLVRQSDWSGLYEAHLRELANKGVAYVCDCSRRTIAEAAGGDPFNEETPYPGTCRNRALTPGPGRGWRVIMEPGDERFTDLRLGPQVQHPSEQCGDVLVQDRLGQWTYQFAVAADDMEQGIGLVVRGEDLLGSTGRQIRLARLMGRSSPPRFLHHPLLRKPDGSKLSKSAGDTGVRELRAAGRAPAEVIGLAAHAAGLSPAPEPVAARDVAGLVRGRF
jgi:glutamyl-tRNA synthetase/glutamyl-Q tRNA(Asp) synthetase